jgi:hypothetical protein
VRQRRAVVGAGQSNEPQDLDELDHALSPILGFLPRFGKRNDLELGRGFAVRREGIGSNSNDRSSSNDNRRSKFD